MKIVICDNSEAGSAFLSFAILLHGKNAYFCTETKNTLIYSMKKIYVALAVTALALGACHKHDAADDELKHHHHHHHGPEAAAHSGEGEEHEDGEIVLEPEMAERFGVRVDTLRPAPMTATLRATGVVQEAADGQAVVVAPVAGTVRFAKGIVPGAELRAGAVVATIDAAATAGGDSNAAARAQLEAARSELERLEPLHRDRLVTDDVYNAAVAAYRTASAAYSTRADGGRATSPIAGSITGLSVAQGQYVGVGEPIATVSAARSLVLRVDVPERMRGRLGGVDGVNVRVPGSERVVALKGHRVASPATVAASMPGYVPVYYEFDNDGMLAPGVTVDAWLTSAGDGAEVLSVPRAAISEQQGNYYVYVRLDEDCYMKLPVQPGATDGVRTVITAGLQGGEAVVTEGMTTVRLAEMAGVVPEGHSHNH